MPHKLTPEQDKDILDLSESGTDCAEIAEAYSISSELVTAACKRAEHRRRMDDVTKGWDRDDKGKFNSEQRARMVKLYAGGNGMTIADISRAAGCSGTAVRFALGKMKSKPKPTPQLTPEEVEGCRHPSTGPLPEAEPVALPASISDIDRQIAELERRKRYLTWIASGAKAGVLDLLAVDIKEGNLAHIFEAAVALKAAEPKG